MNILQIDSSALGAQSASRVLTAALAADWKTRHPEATFVRRDLDAAPLPHLTAEHLAGRDAEQAARAEAALQEFLAADVILVGAPMYNFGIPSTLKAWIDRIAVAGRTFRYTAQGPVGLATGKRVVVASARGGAYGEGHAADFQEAYLRQVFRFLGIEDVRFVRAEGLASSPERRAASLRTALESIGAPVAEAA